MNRKRITGMMLLLIVFFISACSNRADEDLNLSEEKAETENEDNAEMNPYSIPEELVQIPEEYYTEADEQGTLEEFNYTTYESMTYDSKSTLLEKRAIVYLPYGYAEDTEYNIFYLMHGGWSNEMIYYLESQQRSTGVRTKDRFSRCGLSIEEMKQELDQIQFYCPHKSYIVNMDYIQTFDKGVVILKNGEKVKVSRLKMRDFKERFYDYLRSRANGY